MTSNARRFTTAICTMTLLAFGMIPAAHAQKEMMGMFYSMQVAPKVCGWKDAAAPTKIDAMIAAQEKGLGITAGERKTMTAAAEAELAASSDCKDGVLRAMYDEAAK
ncbi:MAG: hypothetical protein H7Z10_16220 [Gemmatimonadaceae bacterium]|nr:hypothetical protein [Acetobacteraceae bacterium]